MGQGGYEVWKNIGTYEEILNTGGTYIGVLFSLYCSEKGQLGWFRSGQEHDKAVIGCLEDISIGSVKKSDISDILAQNAGIELKRRVPDSLDMLLDNVGVVSKILDDIRTYNMLKTVGIR